jgi:hypothetical protein
MFGSPYGIPGIYGGRELSLFLVFRIFMNSQDTMSVNAQQHNRDIDEKEDETHAVTMDP